MAQSNQSPGSLRGVTPLAYAGSTPNMVFNTRRPTTRDVFNFELGTWWIIPKKSSNDTNINAREIWVLVANYEQSAQWERITSSKDIITLPNHSVALGTGADTLNSTGPNASSGIPLVSQGLSADPAFTTAVIAGGGTGSTSFGVNQIVVSGATSTTPLASLSSGTSGQYLRSNGAGVQPSWANNSTGGIIITQYNTPGSSGNHVLDVTTAMVEIFAWGGGGGGGGGQNIVSSSPNGGVSGAAGGFIYYKTFVAAFGGAGSSVSYSVGTGGLGGTSGSYGAYGTSSFFGSISSPKSTGQANYNGSNPPDTLPSMVSNGSLIDLSSGAIPASQYSPFYAYRTINLAAVNQEIISSHPSLPGVGGNGASFPPDTSQFRGGSVYSFDGTTLLVQGGITTTGLPGQNGSDGGFIGGMLVAGSGGSGGSAASSNGGNGGWPGGGGGGGASNTGNTGPGGAGGNGGGGRIVVVEYLS